MSFKFSLDSNRLTSTIPTELGGLFKISSYLVIGNNKLSSSLPTQLGQLSLLVDKFWTLYVWSPSHYTPP